MGNDNIKFATRDGLNLGYREAGTGEPPLLFVHGWCCDSSHFDLQMPAFSLTNRTIAIDLRGHGASGKPDQDCTIDVFVDDLIWFINQLVVVRPVIVGHSMGGLVALNLVRRDAGIARGIIMLDAPILPLPDATRALGQQMLEALRTPAYQAVASSYARVNWFNADSPPELVEMIVEGISAAPQEVMSSTIASVLDPSTIITGAIPVPALYIRSTISPTEGELLQSYPDLDIEDVKASHFLQMENPGQINDLIASFLARIA